MKNSNLLYCAAFILSGIFFLAACNKDDNSNPQNPNAGTGTTRDVGNFTKLVNKGPVIVYVTQGDYKPLTVEADSNIVRLIETSVINDTLIVTAKDTIIQGTKPIKVFITVPKILYAKLSGAGGIAGQNKFTYNEPLTYEITGAGGIEAELSTTKLTALLKGAGGIKVKGTVTDEDIKISGAGAFEGDALVAQNAVVNISGTGSAYVLAEKKLDVTISGTGSEFYRGNPAITKNITGIGVIIKL
jgi:Putative auto-transporter adhesin, head GIN domain